MRHIPTPGHPSVAFAGQDVGRVEVLAAARAHLIGKGHHPLDVDDALTERPGLVVRAWWSEALGFVGPDHPDGAPVTVVNQPLEA